MAPPRVEGVAPAYTDPMDGVAAARAAARPAPRVLRIRLSEPARARVAISVVRDRRRRSVGTFRVAGKRGLNKVAISPSLQRRLRARGRYRVTVTARDAVGRKAKPRVLNFRR